MENIFSYQEVWDIINTGYVEPAAGDEFTTAEQTTLTENRKKNLKAIYILHQGIHESIMDRVVYIKEVKKAWDSLTRYYKGSDKVKKVRLQTLKRKYELLKMDSTELIAYFFSRALSLVNEMKANGDTIKRHCSLQSYKQRILEKTAVKPVEEALQSQINWNNEANSRRFQDNKGRKFVDRSKVRYYNCQQIGHFQSECPEPRKDVYYNSNKTGGYNNNGGNYNNRTGGYNINIGNYNNHNGSYNNKAGGYNNNGGAYNNKTVVHNNKDGGYRAANQDNKANIAEELDE
ncbi:ABC transporter H family member 2-like [Papaver somniferum]|uniref:ABC transporter H family member 2-like n=1 Tax=Papaver somniferum TaxID=3469 RepID=UPI000E70566F|nr:ABC transporter H family member 2-like [Papaver somniferum]